MSGLTIVSGPAGSGKTERLVALATARVEADPFAATLVLVPTARHGDQFRRRVVERCGVALNLEVTTLHFFARGVADTGAIPSIDVAAELLRRATRREIDAGTAGRFAAIAETPGLHALLTVAVSELAGLDVEPSALAEAASRAGSADHEALAAVYSAYRDLLDEHGWRDPREAPTLAGEAIDGGAPLPGLVLIDSFEFLNPRELALVAALARRTEVAVALDRDGSERARWTAERLDALEPDVVREDLTPHPGTARVSARTAFDNEAQLREIARAIKQTLAEDSSLRPSDFAVVFRQAAPHLTLARRVFAEYDLPFDPAAGERLASRPFGAWVLQLLRLPQHDWRLTRVAALLRSAFLDRSVWGVEGDTVDHALRAGRRLKLFSGVDAFGRLARALAAAADDTGEGREGYARRLRIASEAIEGAAAGLTALLGGGPRTAGAWAAALDEALFGADGLARASVEGYDSLDVETSALRADLDALRAIDEALGSPKIRLDEFADELEARMQRPGTLLREAGGVLLAPMHTLHGLRFAHVFVGGLAEGEFPAPRRSGGFLDRRGRELLEAGGLTLPPEARATEDELWATASTRAGTSLSLWRPRFDEGGRPRAPSWYWHEAASAPEAVRLDEIAAPAPEVAASLRELAVALSSGWRDGEQRRPRGLDAWPLVVRTAAPVEQRRRSFAAAGAYEGDLTGIAVSSTVERLTGESARWSASRLESYRTCAFQFFGGYALGLREVEEEHVEADAAIRGSVVHKILEEALDPLFAEGRALLPETLDAAVARMRELGRELWEAAPTTWSFGRAALWRYEWDETAGEIERLLQREAEANASLGVERIAGLEAPLDGTAMPGVEPRFELRGNIDRVDEGPGFIQIVDYKTGRDIKRKDVEEGRRIQLQLYAIAAREQRGAERLVARYAYLRPPNREWLIDTAKPEDAALVDEVARHAGVARASIADGDFRVDPQVPCPSYCDFRHACRVNQFTRSKQWI